MFFSVMSFAVLTPDKALFFLFCYKCIPLSAQLDWIAIKLELDMFIISLLIYHILYL